MAVACIAVFGLGSYASAKTDVPKFTNYVVDNANVLDDATEQAVNNELKAYQDRSTNQVAILLVGTTSPQSIENYAVDVGRAWGVGQKGKDNGVLVVIAMNDRRGRIEVGYGLQDEMPDIRAREILDTQTFPRLKSGNVNEAVQATATAIRAQLGDTGVTPPALPANAPKPSSSNAVGTFFALLPFLLFVLFAVVARRGGRNRRGDGLADGLLWGSILGGLGSSFPSSRGSDGLGGFGGFGGGGGGSFGGGGASGDW